MTLLIGALLGTGLLLCASPWLWPLREKPVREPRSTRLRRLLDEAGHARTATRTVVAIV
ncbi:type II secretion protein F, partial [Bacillus tequilensis]|nr:type II secretion protein F [Bacillus tequilensis]